VPLTVTSRAPPTESVTVSPKECSAVECLRCVVERKPGVCPCFQGTMLDECFFFLRATPDFGLNNCDTPFVEIKPEPPTLSDVPRKVKEVSRLRFRTNPLSDGVVLTQLGEIVAFTCRQLLLSTSSLPRPHKQMTQGYFLDVDIR